MADTLFEKATRAAEFVLARTPVRPLIGIVLGSGLGAFAEQIENAVAISFADIPHFPQSTVPGHSGRLVIGTLSGMAVAVMQGRVHAYEGYSSEQVTFPIRVLGRMGVQRLVLTNAAGGINPALHQGQLVLLSDHINLSGRNPAAGANDDRFGPRFFDMSEAYSVRLRKVAHEAAHEMDFRLDEGVYLSVLGPSFETPAEIRGFSALGADLIGMSTVQETIAARQMGMEVLGISCVTNMAAGIQKEPLSHEEVIATGRAVEAQLAGLLTRVVGMLAR
ncbi:MAG TPA: purine-nucleoside phosphorylase [Acidobacteriaceae bacterium]|jgi:purine-nucleoside phosphorylase|nr:purine-nucleoside phosphorylase [Acidobacteriaceae bacterium]